MPEPTSPAAIRWWPAAAILMIAAAALGWTWLTGDPITQYRVMRTMLIAIVSSVALLVWFAALSRLPGIVRRRGLAAVLLIAVAAVATLRVRGVDGDLVPILAWRWRSAPSDSSPDAAAAPTSSASASAVAASADHAYPQFLGPTRNAVVTGVALARDWSRRPPREVWRRPVGPGWSSFAVVARLAVTQEQRGDDELVTAYDLATGELVWTHADVARYDTTLGGAGPRATPTIVDGRVYTLGATGLLNALDLTTGAALWQRDVAADSGADEPPWGRSGSPLVVDNLVVVGAGGRDGKSVIAYRRDDGATAWHAGDDATGYASPLVTKLDGQRQIVMLNAASITAHEPTTGAVLWQTPWPAEQPNVAQPLVLPGDRLLVSAGYGVGAKMYAIAGDASGTLSASMLWESPRLKAKFANIVQHDGVVYGLDDGTLVCLDPETGERRWKKGRYGHGQLILVDDLLLIQDESGDVVLVGANPDELRELSRIEALTGKTWNTPALAGPYLLVRNDREAACYELPLADSTD